MTQLLISVKNLEESKLARYAEVDVIDLKDPAVGALGALDIDVVKQIVQSVNGATIISATVGEGHQSIEALKSDIQLYADVGVDIVKIAVSEHFEHACFLSEMRELASQGIQMVAVFFADEPMQLDLIRLLGECGFYGAMLDTQNKQTSLVDIKRTSVLEEFVALCNKHQLISGLAGSVNKSALLELVGLEPTFVGMRGGVCEKQNRVAALSNDKLNEVKDMLLNCNNSQVYAAKNTGLNLQN